MNEATQKQIDYINSMTSSRDTLVMSISENNIDGLTIDTASSIIDFFKSGSVDENVTAFLGPQATALQSIITNVPGFNNIRRTAQETVLAPLDGDYIGFAATMTAPIALSALRGAIAEYVENKAIAVIETPSPEKDNQEITSHAIKMTVSGELYAVIANYSDAHGCTIAYASAQICAIGAETITGGAIQATANEHGGARPGAGRPREIAQFVNIDERYGDGVPVTIAEYIELNPTGEFEERSRGIFENVGGEWVQIAGPSAL